MNNYHPNTPCVSNDRGVCDACLMFATYRRNRLASARWRAGQARQKVAREASALWRGWIVTAVFNRGYACLGIARADGADNPRGLTEAHASRNTRHDKGVSGLTRPEARVILAALNSKLNGNGNRRARRARRA